MEAASLAGEMPTVMSWSSNWEKQHRRLINEVKLSKKAENGKCEREKEGELDDVIFGSHDRNIKWCRVDDEGCGR